MRGAASAGHNTSPTLLGDQIRPRRQWQGVQYWIAGGLDRAANLPAPRCTQVHAEPQDILQVWFAGVHADIGGGYPEKQSGLSKYPLLWMIDEAIKCGLTVNQATVNQLAWGVQRKGSPFSYVVPDMRGDLHTSLRGAWWILEYIPKRASYKEWPARKAHFGYYIPDAEPRFIPDGAIIHESVLLRIEAMPSYRPVNLPK